MSVNQIRKLPQLNNQMKNAFNYIADKMPSAQQANLNPVELLTPEEITYLQTYLQQIKVAKLNQVNRQGQRGMTSNQPINMEFNRATDIYDPIGREVPVDVVREFNKTGRSVPKSVAEPGSRGAASTRTGKRSQQNYDPNNYYNPYEYGARQNQLGPQQKEVYTGPYNNDPNMMGQMGLENNRYCEQFPGQIRNVNVESSLIQREMTHLPGQRELTQKEINRFELLPFDPQDTRHIVWSDMPRGGHPTRVDRLET